MQVTHEGASVEVGGRPRDLLALLVACHPAGVTLEGAGDAVWPEKPAADALNNVRVNFSKLRKMLPDRDLVVFADGRYHLRLAEERIDVHRFRAGVTRARTCADTGNPRGAVDAFDETWTEWRGTPFEESFGIEPVDGARYIGARPPHEVTKGLRP
jgi:DNA-binding SARP family transcriptional activator